jgi:cytochrome c-type biogenesis protein CcmH
MLARLLLLLSLLAWPAAAPAVQPDEVLANPALEERARRISAELRCLVCQNQSIDDSDAALARDLRVLVRERLKAGDSDAEIMDFIVSRYGEFVLLRPRFSLQTALLWATPALLLAAGGLFLLWQARRLRDSAPPRLNAEEERALNGILNDRDGA